MPDIVIHVVASALYAALALHFWQTRWRVPSERWQAGAAGSLAGAALGLRPWERSAILAPLALHAWILYDILILAEQPRFGFAFALSATLWLALFVYWCESFLVELEGILPPALGLAALCVPLTYWFPGLVKSSAPFEYRLHMLLSIVATGVLTLALLHALLMALMDRVLHGARGSGGAAARSAAFGGPLTGLPPLLTLERLLFRLIWIAFIMLTLTLATGLTLSEMLFGRALRFNHETVFAVIAWIAFAVLLLGRHLYGWRGRTALRWTLAGFMLVILANIGSTFVLEVVLRRG